jgi:hypothetical protein
MKKSFGFVWLVLAVIVAVLLSYSVARADGVIPWTGNGSDNLPCEYGGYWVLAPGFGIETAVLTVNGNDYTMEQVGNNWKATSVGYLDGNLNGYVNYTGPGDERDHLQLSHCEPANPPPTPTPLPPTATPTQTPVTPTSTYTFTPTFTPTFTGEPPTATPTETNVPTNTPTITPTRDPGSPTPTVTGTQPTPTETTVPTETPTSQPSLTPTNTQPPVTPTSTATTPPVTPTSTATAPPVTVTPTVPPMPTSTPKPPNAGVADDMLASPYPSDLLWKMTLDGKVYDVYTGVNAADGTLMLPTKFYGGALYNNIIWVHRLWRGGYINLDIGDTITITDEHGYTEEYKVTDLSFMEYGVYPKTLKGSDYKYIATCYSNGETFIGVELFKLVRVTQKGH